MHVARYLQTMEKKSILPALLLFFVLSWNACRQQDVEFRADSSHITYMGRTYVTDNGGVAFNYPGVTALLSFEGSRLDMLASRDCGDFMVEVDGGVPRRLHYGENDSLLTVADSLGEGPHSVRITYAIEGYEKNPVIRGFVMPGGSRLLDAPKKGKLKMEFIGNSITCGYGAAAPDGARGFSYDTDNHCLTYAYLTGRALDADVNVVARSGIGMYRNYNGPLEGDSVGTMPMEYDRTLLYDAEHMWDFSRFQPDVVCINLGTNDTSTDNYDISLFERAYDGFLTHLREVYPSAKIVLLTGSMLQGQPLEDVRGALDRLASRHEGTYRFDMSPQTGELGMGADGHPSARQHARMAEELTKFIQLVISN